MCYNSFVVWKASGKMKRTDNREKNDDDGRVLKQASLAVFVSVLVLLPPSYSLQSLWTEFLAGQPAQLRLS